MKVLLDATTTMSEGEVLQLVNSDNLEINEQEYLEVITRKTAVLISAACQTGAIFGGGQPADEQLRGIWAQSGIAFQLIDDTLDFTGEAEELGESGSGRRPAGGKGHLAAYIRFRSAEAADRHKLKTNLHFGSIFLKKM